MLGIRSIFQKGLETLVALLSQWDVQQKEQTTALTAQVKQLTARLKRSNAGLQGSIEGNKS
jgi:hypothetical protein